MITHDYGSCFRPRKFRPSLHIVLACSIMGLLFFGSRLSRVMTTMRNMETRCMQPKSLAIAIVVQYTTGALHPCFYQNNTDTGLPQLVWPNDTLIDVPTPLYMSSITMGLVLSVGGIVLYMGLLLYDFFMYARYNRQELDPHIESDDDTDHE